MFSESLSGRVRRYYKKRSGQKIEVLSDFFYVMIEICIDARVLTLSRSEVLIIHKVIVEKKKKVVCTTLIRISIPSPNKEVLV